MRRSAVLAVLGVAALSGCTSGSGAMVQSLREMLPQSGSAEAVKLDPTFEYLRVTRGKHVGFLFHGSVERSGAGTVNVYYSRPGEVLRILNGRIVGALGLSTEWRRVDVVAPAWAAIAQAAAGARVVRTRDTMPGYISGLREELVVRRVAPPSASALRAIDPQSLTWFEERIATAPSAAQNLPPARYAVDFARDAGVVIYGEQCLGPDLCFTWQRWSTALQQASMR